MNNIIIENASTASKTPNPETKKGMDFFQIPSMPLLDMNENLTSVHDFTYHISITIPYYDEAHSFIEQS